MRNFRRAFKTRPRPKQWWLVTGAIVVAIGIVAGITLATAGDGALPGQKPKSAQQDKEKKGATSPLHGKEFYVDPHSNAARQALKWRDSRPHDAKEMDKLAKLPSARWITNEKDAGAMLKGYLRAAKQKNGLPVTVAYNIPNRDCGLYSAGGADTEQQYKHFITTYANSVGDTPAVIILEPDALAQLQEDSCLSAAQKQLRYNLLTYAVEKFKALPHAVVYIDAGNSAWIADSDDLANRLAKAGIAKADGFALNVSNFRPNADTITYGKMLSEKTGGKHFVIDTSRNGLGPYQNKVHPEFNWCNPPGRALGHYPTTETNDPLVDAFMFIKNAGESDGADPDTQKCHGGPEAGVWWPEYALGLVQRWPEEFQSEN